MPPKPLARYRAAFAGYALYELCFAHHGKKYSKRSLFVNAEKYVVWPLYGVFRLVAPGLWLGVSCSTDGIPYEVVEQ